MGFRKKITVFFAALVLYCFLQTKHSFALVINEIYPAPAQESEEWVELYNNSGEQIDLSQFNVSDSTGKNAAFETQTLPPNEFVLAIAKNVFNNSGDTVFLKKITGESIDIATYSGSLDSTKSISRCPDGQGSFTTTQIVTKKSTNNSICSEPTPQSSPLPTISQIITPITYANIYISEVMTYPTSPEPEWVEIFNNNPFEAILTNWYIDDGESSGSNPKLFTLTIAPLSYGVITLASDIFNNDGDTVRILDQTQKQIDSISYTNPQQNKTIGKTQVTTQTICVQQPTKGQVNGPCLATELSNTTTQTKTTVTPSPDGVKQSIQTTTTKLDETAPPSKRALITIHSKPPKKKDAALVDIDSEPDILGAADNVPHRQSLVYAKSSAVSSYLISLFTISYLLHKIVKKVKS